MIDTEWAGDCNNNPAYIVEEWRTKIIPIEEQFKQEAKGMQKKETSRHKLAKKTNDHKTCEQNVVFP